MQSNSCPAGHDPKFVGDPVDTLTGAVVDRMLDFRLTGPIDIRWTRHYDSSQSHRSFSLGTGCAHEFDRSLSFDSEWILYEEPVGRSFRFPLPNNDGEECALHGFTLRRVSSACYFMFRNAQPAMEFVFAPKARRARLTRLLLDSSSVKFWYDATQKLVRIDDSAGRLITAREDEAGRLIRLAVEATSNKAAYLLVAYHYDECGNLIATENDKGHGYAFAYDETNRLVLRRGRKGFQFYFKYDAQGRCIQAKGDDRLYGVALEYKVPQRVTKVTRPDRGVWTYRFTPRGELQEVQDPLGGIQKFIRDASGRQVLDVDPNGNVFTFVYDFAGEAIGKVDPLGHWIELPGDPNAPDPLFHEVAANPAEYEYGRLFDIEKIVLPDRAQAQRLPLSREARSFVVVRIEEKHRPDAKSQFEVPPLRVLWWPEPNSGRIFNDLGQLVQQRDEFGRLRQWTYDESGNAAEHVDFDGGRWLYDYGSWHFLRGITNPLGAEVRFSPTAYEEVSSFTDAGGTCSEYHYDLKDNLVDVRRHGVVRETYTRDPAGNLIAKHASDGRELLRLEIGPGNLPIQVALGSGDVHTFEYDKMGRALLVSTQIDRVEFSYDALGNPVLEKRNGHGVAHDFQDWQRPAESIFFDHYHVHYDWVDDGMLIITDPGGKSHEIRFLQHGLVERRFSNGSQETAQYDNLGRCLFKHAQWGQGQVWSRRYHWSGEGELHRIEDNVLGLIHHEYDVAHRLRRRFIEGRIETYDLDSADNLIMQPGLGGVTLEDGNRLKTANGFSFEYNDRNHIKFRQTSDNWVRYLYDSSDQLIRVETPKGIWAAEYDALGRRTRKTWAGATTEYYWNGDQLVAEINHLGKLRLYIYADFLALTPLMRIDYDSIDAPTESARRYIIFSDQIGTPVFVEDEQDGEVWRACMTPFGAAEVAPGAKIEFNCRFPGHYFDVELGLHYNRFRYYDPILGRYLQSDPWGIAGGFNLYAYFSNPLLTADVRGLGEEGKKCGPKEKRTEGTKKSSKTKKNKENPLADMDDKALKAHVEKRAKALKKAFVKANDKGESATTLSVGIVQKGNDKSTRRVVVTTSADNQKLPKAVRKAMKPGEQHLEDPSSKVVRGPRRSNEDYDPKKAKREGPDPRNNPQTVTDPKKINPDTGRPNKYTKAKNGEPTSGTQHHAEQRMENGAAQNGEKVLAQQPTKPCCPGCTKVLTNNKDISKVPNPECDGW